MIRVNTVRGIAVSVMLLLASSAFGAVFTSSQSGPWSDVNTWGGAGVPSFGDDVTITGNHVVTVSDQRFCQALTLDGTAGNKMLVVQTGGHLIAERAASPAIVINAPAPGSANVIQIDGGLLETSDNGISITGGASSIAKLEFTSLGGTARLTGDLLFAGTPANAVLDFGNSTGSIEIGGDLDSGGALVNNSAGTVVMNGTGTQTVNGYPFHHFTVNKSGGTATLNGPITINGDFNLTQGLFDDGGYQISLNAGSTSTTTIGASGVLKLGSAGSATVFPTPHGAVNLAAGSSVVYQSGAAQTIDSTFPYQGLYLSTLGPAVSKTPSGATLTVNGELTVLNNGLNGVTLDIGAGALDANGNISGDGTIELTSGTINLAGNWSAAGTLNPGTGLVTYDGNGAQSIRDTTYHDLAIAKSGGAATLTGLTTVNGDLTVSSGTFSLSLHTLALLGDFSNSGSVSASSGTIQLNGSGIQTWSSASLISVNALDLNNSSGVVVSGDLAITGSLDLDGGTLTTSDNVFIDVLASVTHSSGWIVGELTMGMNPAPARRFYIGTASAYLPVDVDSGSAGTVTLTAMEGKSPDRTAENVLARFWRIDTSSATPLDGITFNYNQSDVVTGDETMYILAHYDVGSQLFTHYGGVNVAANSVAAAGVGTFVGDWIIGQPGSLAAASKLAITSINGGVDPNVNAPFSVVIEAQDDDGDITPVFDPTNLQLSLDNGTGTIGGTLTGTIGAGLDTTTITGVTYDTVENGLLMRVVRLAGDILDDGTSTFDVIAAPTTYTVTSINDSGAGTLRQGILDANSGTCGNPCTIDFATSGEINLASPLPAITADNVVIDGYTAPGSSENTNAFGLASNAVLTMAINGGNSVGVGFDVQATFVKISGFAIKNFTSAGVVFDGDNSGASVSGCYIGTDVTGMNAAPNATGVRFTGSAEATVGGLTPADRNVISGNTAWGITTDLGANTIGIHGNYVGVKADLSGPLANNIGVEICSGCSVSVGTSGIGNIISGNTTVGLVLAGDGASIKKNYIGTAGLANSAIANATGIRIDAGANFNVIGGSSPSDTNVISGNTQNGILIDGDDNTIDNNIIGLTPDGTSALGNGASGVRLENAASRNLIGTLQGNKIAYNSNDGVSVATTSGIGNTIRKSMVKANGNRAIDLGDNGLTPNDATDSDTGANNLQNFPSVSLATYGAGNLAVKTSLNSSSGISIAAVHFDFYKADGAGQALQYLGSSGCQAGNVFSNFVFNIATGAVTVGDSIVGTATAYSDVACSTPSEGTSELSVATVIDGDIHWIAGSGSWETPGNWSPAVVPGANDNAIIDNNGTYTVTINSIVSVGSLQLGAASGTQTLQINGASSLSFDNASAVSASSIVNHAGNTLGGTGALSVLGTLNWSAGAIAGAGGLTMQSGATLNINGAGAKALTGGSLLNIAAGATANWIGGAITLSAGGSIDNNGTFSAQSNDTIGDGGGAGTFDNFGTFTKSIGTGATAFVNLTFNHNAGLVDVLTGRLDLAGGTSNAPWAIASGADVYIDDSTYTFASSGATGAGKVYINGGTLSATGSPVTFEHLRLDAGTLGGNGNARTTTGGSWIWNGGTMSGGGTTTIESGASLQISTSGTKTLNNRNLTVQPSGSLLIDGTGAITMSTGGTINNAGTVDNNVDMAFNDGGVDGGIFNTGLWKKSGGTLSSNFTNVDFTNSGTLKVLAASLNPSNVNNTGAIELTGTFVLDDGSVILSGASDVSGAGLLQLNGATLTVQAVDALPNVQFDSGILNGVATFDINTLVWNGGTMSGTGATNIPNLATATIAGLGAKSLQRTFRVSSGGTATVTGSGTINLSAGGSIDNDGLFDFASDATVADAGGDSGFLNSATLRKSAGALATTFSAVDLTNSGTIEVQTGTLNTGNVTSTGNIVLTGTMLVDDSTVTLTAGDVSGSGLLRINGGTLTANANDTFPNVQLDLGTLQGAGLATIQSLVWSGGAMSGAGTTTIPALGTATLSGIGAKSLQRAFTIANGGAFNITGSGTFNFSGGGNITNDGTLEITTPMTFNDGGAGGDINNSRTFRANAAGGVTLSGITLNNTGGSALVDVISGTLDLADGASSGAWAIGGSATLLVNSDSYTFGTGTTVTGGGLLNLTGGTLFVSGNVSVPNLTQTAATIDGSGTLTLTGNSTWNTGTQQGGGTTHVTGTLGLSTPSGKVLNNRTLSVGALGTINVDGNGPVNLQNGGNISNAGAFNVTTNNSFSDSGAGGNFVNTGTFTKTTSFGPTTFFQTAFTNNGGMVDLQTGTLTVTSDTFTQSSGTLKLWLNGTTPGIGFAQLSTNTTPTLGGTLQIALTGPYQPVAGDTFRVVSASAHSGDFTQPYWYPALAAGRTFSDAYDASGLLLTVSGNADLSIAKSAPSNVLVGGAIAYTLTVNNAGPDAANAVSVTDILQAGHTFGSASGTGWTCNNAGLTVTCTAATLATGTAPAITINATAPNTPQTFTNIANVDASNDPNAANDSGSAVVTVDPNQADLDVSATSPATPVPPSTAFTFDFAIRNDGPQTATNVVFTAPIPATLTYNSATPDSGSCSFAASTVTCNLGSILTNGTVHVLLGLTATSTAGTHTVNGSAVANETDPMPGNNDIEPAVEVTGSTLVVTNVSDAGPGSLREAIEDANNGVCTPLPCTISFNIGAAPFVIQPATELPAIADQIIIDGTTQPGYTSAPLVQIDGQDTLSYALSIAGDNSTIRGLSLTAADYGVDILGNANTIQANYIGLNGLGGAAANGAGIQITGDNNIVGGTTAAQRNVISSNTGFGVFLSGTATGNKIAGNYIGTDPAGTAARPNNVGVSVTDEADTTTIGGATPAHGNLISGNTNWGVYVEGSGNPVIAGGVGTTGAAPGDDGVAGTTIQNNWIGPDINGSTALGGLTAGLSIVDHADGTVVSGNTISGHANGITIDSPNVTDSTFTGNMIGTSPDGLTAMPNIQAGILIADGSDNNFAGNTIAYNGGNGIVLYSGNTSILSNNFHDNTLLAIDLGGDGVDAIDAGDADAGPNGLQNAPTLGSATLTGGGNVHVTYSLDSSATSAASMRLEFFKADSASEEGQVFLGATCVAGNTFSSGASFNAPALAAGDSVVATATSYSDAACTNVADGTSEFSSAIVAAACVPPAVTITGPASFCAGSGPVTLDAGAGFASYLWNTGATTRTISVNPAGTTNYTVTVTTPVGCTNSDSHLVTVNPLPTVVITGPATVCAGGTVTLDAGAGFTSYLWNNGATTRTISVSPATTTIYSVTATDGNSCSGSDTHTVTVTANPVVTITGDPDTCSGTPVTLDAGPGFASYLWNNGATTQTITVSPTTTTTYGVTVGDGSCTATDNHTVTVNPAPPAPSITPSGPLSLCAGDSVTLTASNGTSWLWNTGATTQSINVTAGGSYTVQIFSGSCSATAGPVTVTVNPAPAVTITGPAATCNSAPVTLDAGPGFASYAWSNGATTQTITVSPSTTASYSVTVTNAQNCSASDSHTVTVSANPVAAISAPAGVCESSNNAASVAAQPGATYTWTISNGAIASGQGTNAITFNSGTTGSVTLAVTVAAGSCTSNGSVVIPISPRPSAVITAPVSATPNQTSLTASVPAQPGATYNWSVSNGSVTSGSGTNAITFTAGASNVTTLAVTVTIGSCSESNTHHVFIDAPQGGNDADLSITKSAPATVQPGAAIVYTIAVANRGPLAASGVVINDSFPAGTSFVSVEPGPWNCTRLTSSLRCTGSLGASSTSTIALTLTAPQSGTVVNIADVFASTPDPDPSNNSASAATSITTAPPVCPSTSPLLQGPANGSTVSSPATFTWSAVANAIEYELWIDDSLVATTPALTHTRPIDSGQHSWFVVARLGGGCDPLPSATRTFIVAVANNCPTQAPVITAPAHGATVSAPVTFFWTPVANAIGYRVWISANGTATYDAGTTDAATMSLSASLPTGSITAVVDALFGGCEPARSAPITINVPAPDPCAARAASAPLSPSNNAVVNSSSVDFSWTPVAGADGYRLWFSLDGAAPAVLGNTTDATTLRAAIGRGTVVWWIETLFDGCASVDSTRFVFTIPARNDCSNARPELLAPARNSVTSSASTTFTWSAVTNAVSYELWLAVDNGTPALFGTTTSTSMTGIVPPGKIDWSVVAVVDRCGPRESQQSRFTYTPPASCASLQRATLVEPLPGAEVNAPVSFSWNDAPGATSYAVYVIRNGETSLVASTSQTAVSGVNLAAGRMHWFVRASFGGNCSPLDSEIRELAVVAAPPACSVLAAPAISAPGQISSNVPFLIQWTPVSGATTYQLQIADNPQFGAASTITTAGTQHQLVRNNNLSEPLAVYARVRAVDGRCRPIPSVSPYGDRTVLFILPSNGNVGSVPLGAESATFFIPLGAELAGQTFTAVAKQPWLTVLPPSGVVGANGTVLSVTAHTTALPVGTSLGGVILTLSGGGAAGGVSTNSTSTTASSYSVTLVTPVFDNPKNTPPPDALIIPAVAHAGGINSQFQSDVRVSNTSPQLVTYQITFTPSGDSGITDGQQSTFSIEPGRTVALDDILQSWFGTGNGSAMGTLEIRPLTQTATATSGAAFSGLQNLLTFASSRTFNLTANGTFGQYIPAIPFANFVGRATEGQGRRLLSLQQIAQSSKYRTNLGVVEGSGDPAELVVRIFGESGQYLTEFPLSLKGGQHLQLNAFLRNQGIDSLADGRVEVEVVGGDGKVTAYASVLDNETSDPLLVTPVNVDDVGATKWVVPGVADLVSGFANWQTDMRLFNAGTSDVETTLSFYSQGGGEPKVRTLTIPAGQVMQFDRTLATLFETTNDGGAVHISTAEPAKLIATARTYNQTGGGTYGQFISAVTPNEAAGVDSRPLQLLQVEETDRFRSNIGFVEVTGKPVTIEISVVPPDAKFTALTELTLQPNEFRQLGGLLRSMGLGDTHNARVTVRAISGEGRITAYASVIDMQTNDPTYIPAQ